VGGGGLNLQFSMPTPLFRIDAFTRTPFAGNPAAVVPLLDHDAWPDDELLQAIAQENNLSETAYLRTAPASSEADYLLRWFTPAIEVNLCGHATLASGHALRNHLGVRKERIAFETRSGIVSVEQGQDGRLVLDFPAAPPRAEGENDGDKVDLGALCASLGDSPSEDILFSDVAREHTPVCIFDSEADVRALKPNFGALATIGHGVLIATAPGHDSGVDFVSRFFAPGAGIDEDPVTGSTHCALTPYWAKRLSKTTLRARQISRRTGELWCELVGERVRIGGSCVTTFEGTMDLGALLPEPVPAE